MIIAFIAIKDNVDLHGSGNLLLFFLVLRVFRAVLTRFWALLALTTLAAVTVITTESFKILVDSTHSTVAIDVVGIVALLQLQLAQMRLVQLLRQFHTKKIRVFLAIKVGQFDQFSILSERLHCDRCPIAVETFVLD